MADLEKEAKLIVTRAKQCPRRGVVKLEDDTGWLLATKTTCKTWGCKVCRERVAALVRLRMEYGCLKLRDSFLITLTYANLDMQSLRDAHSVQVDLERFWKSLRKRNPQLSYFKIVEMTKRKQIHLHLIVGGITSDRRDTCDKTFYKRRREVCKFDCLHCELVKVWESITGSFVIDVRKVYASSGLANYLGKYLTKQFYNWDQLEERGFKRRWSRSKNWPSPGPLRLLGTVLGVWRRIVVVEHWYKKSEMEALVEASKNDPLMQIVGDDLAIELGKKRRDVGLIRRLEGYLNEFDIL